MNQGPSSGLQLLAENLGVAEDCIPLHGIATIVYMTPDGEQGYSSSFLGEARGTQFVGLLEYLKADVMDMGKS